ncbi:hypothetical protein M3593_06260 [Mesobacillus sp. MER 48]|nr:MULTISPECIES: hypothetical protein [unclassified Mesobacillus]MCM3122760.1 hypothetical protein [Mesobacillus sp. MER 33]MCM3232724.1 hypothetical protein [Mesobacillus sp. MER 48]
MLKILSDIWKSGANIYLDHDDDCIAIKNQHLIPGEVMQAAEENFQDISNWFNSWKTESSQNITLMKMIHHISSWKNNEKLNDWLCSELDSLDIFNEWMIVLAKNGWKDIYEDHRQFENEESIVMAQEIFRSAVTYAKKKVKV